MNDFIIGILVMIDVTKWKRSHMFKLINLIKIIPAEKGLLVSRNPVQLLALTAEICSKLSKNVKII